MPDSATVLAEIRACQELDSWGGFQEEANKLSVRVDKLTFAEFQRSVKNLAEEANNLGMWYEAAQENLTLLLDEMQQLSDEAEKSGDALINVRQEATENKAGAVGRIKTLSDDALSPRIVVGVE